jgi:transcriptional regulator with XRE-family HTH domain
MSRSLKVRSDCIKQAKLAIQHNGFPSQRAFAEELGLALSTLSRFLTGKTVDCVAFVEICGKLAIDWREISDKRISKVVQAPGFIRGVNLKSKI